MKTDNITRNYNSKPYYVFPDCHFYRTVLVCDTGNPDCLDLPRVWGTVAIWKKKKKTIALGRQIV